MTRLVVPLLIMVACALAPPVASAQKTKSRATAERKVPRLGRFHGRTQGITHTNGQKVISPLAKAELQLKIRRSKGNRPDRLYLTLDSQRLPGFPSWRQSFDIAFDRTDSHGHRRIGLRRPDSQSRSGKYNDRKMTAFLQQLGAPFSLDNMRGHGSLEILGNGRISWTNVGDGRLTLRNAPASMKHDWLETFSGARRARARKAKPAPTAQRAKSTFEAAE